MSGRRPTPTIPAGERDWEEVAELLAGLRAEERRLDPLAGELLDGGRPLAELMRRMVGDDRGAVLVSRGEGGGLAGMVFALHQPPGDGTSSPPCQGLISHLYVRPAARRSGVGRGLVEAAVAHLAARGCRAVDLAVHARNRAALALYRGTGWGPSYRLLRRELPPLTAD